MEYKMDIRAIIIRIFFIVTLLACVSLAHDVAGQRLKNVADPTAEQDAATKIWVETQISDANGTTQEIVQDWIWSASSIGTTTLIVLTYDDTNNEIDFVVDEASIDHDALTNFISGEHFLQSAITEVGTIATGVWNGTVLTVPYGGTGAATLTDGGILLGSGTGAITALGVLADGSIVIGDGTTDPVALAAFTSSTGDLIHEAGGLEADVSAYTGLVAISGGATAEIDALTELEGQIADVTAFVVEGTACSDIEGTGLSIATGTLNWACPADAINDTHIDLGVGANQVSGSDMPNEDLGDISVSSGSWTLDNDVVAPAEMADADHGDISWTSGVASIDADAVTETDLKAVNAATDEDILTYESTTGDFEWHTPSEIVTAGTNISWSSTTLNVDDAFLVNNANDTTTGTLTADALKATGNGLIWSDGTTGTTPASGAGTRLMWIPAKKAFRAGYVSAEQWDNANIGTSSVAMGYDANASGNYSTAIGYTLTASGYGSTAIGFGADAIGNYSVAIGRDTTASGSFSTTLGKDTIASGDYSTAIGLGSTASGDYSTAMGYDTTASGDNSTSMGKDTNSASYISVALGRFNVGGGTTDSWVATDPLFEIGIGADADNLANALTVLKNGNTTINGNLTLTTTKNFTLGTTQWDDGSDKIEGNILANDSVDDDAIDFTSITLADFTDDLGADSGHTHTTTTISGLDISDDTNLAAGTNITLSGDTLNVDDAFLRNDGDDSTSGVLTATGFALSGGEKITFQDANTYILGLLGILTIEAETRVDITALLNMTTHAISGAGAIGCASVSATGNIGATNFVAGGTIAATGNVTGANLEIAHWDTAYDWGNHSAGLDTDEIFNAGGDLKIQPDVGGDVVFFGDTDVNDLANGGVVYIYRKAEEGDAHLSIYIDQYGRPRISGGDNHGDFLFASTAAGADFQILADDGDVQLQSSAAGDVVIFRDAADGENRSVKQAGYITDGADEVEIMWTVKDTDDYFHLERENTKILGFKIDMPVVMPNLPVADPSVAGALWNDSGTLKISAG